MLEMPFSPGDEAHIHLSGAHAIHLTGFLELDDDDDESDDDDVMDELDECAPPTCPATHLPRAPSP